jgi:hypothetical protein
MTIDIEIKIRGNPRKNSDRQPRDYPIEIIISFFPPRHNIKTIDKYATE